MSIEKKWIIRFENGYCGCDEEEEFFGTYEEAESWAKDSLYDYAEQYAHCAFGWDGDYTEEEFEDYIADCGFTIEEESEEEDDD